MRIDPTSVFFHTIVSLPLRLVLAWCVGTLGAFTPVWLRGGVDAFAIIGWQLLLFPIYLFFVAIISGWWGLAAVPLLIVLAWRLLLFVRDESDTLDLLWIYLLSMMISIRASGGALPVAVLIVAAMGIYLTRLQRQLPRSTL
jgi:hypothetical protein